MKKNISPKNKKISIKLWSILAGIVLLILIALNWNHISWLFNFQYTWRYLTGVLSPTGGRTPPSSIVAPKTQNSNTAITPENSNSAPVSQTSSQPINGTAASGIVAPVPNLPDTITIPKINISAPIITAQTADADAIHSLLDSGTVLYPGSVPFGQRGESVILGHSAPAGWPKIKYDWVFSELAELKEGDKIYITYANKKYSYTVAKIKILQAGQDLPGAIATANTLVLVSCWPPGKDINRLAVLAVLDGQSPTEVNP